MNLNDFKSNILCPQNRICYPESVKHSWGNVENAENLLNGKSETTVLKYDGDTAPKLLLHLGRPSTGGYPVFKVKSFKGDKPVIRLAYSDWYDYIMEEKTGEDGDFQRGVCKYLGVELPVLPGDPNRFNLFTITHNGEYISPLVQGQQNWLMIKLETPNTEVELEYAYIYYTSDASAYDGGFDCSDPELTRLWYASCWTCQIATITNSHSWDTLNNTLLLRALTKGNDAGYYKNGLDLIDYTVEFEGAIANNPQMCSGIGVLVRATDIESGYAIFINLDGSVVAYVRKNNVYTLLAEAQSPIEIIDNKFYNIKVTCEGDEFTLYIDGEKALSFNDSTYKKGSFGFCQTTEKWALAKNLSVKANGEVIWSDDFSADLDAYEFTRSAPFVSDGAKRDRLPWIGDLDWAGRNIYYAFRNFKAMPESLRMFAFHQTPEGYIWGTCYPENRQKPAIGEYGYYESDIFSAWIVPTLADYLLFTGDTKFCEEIYQAIKDDVNYLWRFVEKDGLFNQRYATSKGLWDHVLNDMGKFTYNNLIISEAFKEAAYIADILGYTDDKEEFTRRATIVRKAIKDNFTSPEGWLTKSLTNRDMCEMSNSLALSVGYFENAADAKASIDALVDRTPGHAKTAALMIRGAFMYGYDFEAINTIRKPGYSYVIDSKDFVVFDALEDPNFDFRGHNMHPANWLKAFDDWRGPLTTWECMTYPPFPESRGQAWGDRSHPDTAIAHILTGYILGILPEKAGFETFTFEPHTSGLSNAKGIIPTTRGDIYASWEIIDGVMTVKLDYSDKNKLAHIRLNKADATSFNVIVNGNKVEAKLDENGYLFF